MRKALAIAVVLASVMLPAHADTCGRVHGLGEACVSGGVYRMTLRDGAILLTHGHDVLPAPVAVAAAVPPVCEEDRDDAFHGVALYARAVDLPDNYEQRAREIREMIAEANGMLRAESGEFGRTMDYRMYCEGGQVAVLDVVLPTPLDSTTFFTVVSDLRDLGFASEVEKYWVFFDGHPKGTAGGTGTIVIDSSDAASNENNIGPSYGVDWGYGRPYGATVLMHENGHNLGAVQIESPRSSGAYHCNDGLDVMCYADGGPASAYDPTVCSALHFDCGHDDYFHPDPPAGSWLADHWNLGSPLNRFLAGCVADSGTLVIGLGGAAHDGISARTVGIQSGCAGRPYALSGFSRVDRRTGSFPGLLRFADLNACFYSGSSLLRCDAAFGPERGLIPAGATRVQVILAVGADAVYSFNAV